MSPDPSDRRYPLFKVGGEPAEDAEAESDPEAIRSVARRAVEESPSAIARAGVAPEELLSVEDFAERIGADPEGLREAIERHELISVSEGAALQVPAFQLSLDPDRLAAVVAQVSKSMLPVSKSSRTLWLWFVAPKPDLAGSTPAQWIEDGRDPAAVVLAAERDAARLGS